MGITLIILGNLNYGLWNQVINNFIVLEVKEEHSLYMHRPQTWFGVQQAKNGQTGRFILQHYSQQHLEEGVVVALMKVSLVVLLHHICLEKPLIQVV